MKKKNEEPTFLQEYLKDKEILTKRPADMDFKYYREQLKIQGKIIKYGLR
jgi:hypothetical protein